MEKEVRQSLLIGICLSSLATAQNPPRPYDSGNPWLDPGSYLFSLDRARDQVEQEMEQRRQARHREGELIDKMNKIAEVWRGFVEELNTRGTFNIRKARDLSKAFRELERSESWPRLNRAK